MKKLPVFCLSLIVLISVSAFGSDISIEKTATVTFNTPQVCSQLTIKADQNGSGQLIFSETGSITYNRVNFDLELYTEFAGEADPMHWTPFGVPFKPTALVGLDQSGNEVPLVFEEDYMLYKYNGFERANLRQGWKRVIDVTAMESGEGYMLACRKTTKVRFIGGNNSASPIYPYTSLVLFNPLNTDGGCADCGPYEGLNYIAQPLSRNALYEENSALGAYVYDAANDSYIHYIQPATVFRPNQSFVTAVIMDDEALFAPNSGTPINRVVGRSIRKDLQLFQNDELIDRLYMYDAEDADTLLFAKGKELIKMFGMSAPKVPQMWVEAKGLKLTMNQARRINDGARFKLGFYMATDSTITLMLGNLESDAKAWLYFKGAPYRELLNDAKLNLTLAKGFNYDYEVRIDYAPGSTTDMIPGQNAQAMVSSNEGKIYIDYLQGDEEVYCYAMDGRLLHYFPAGNQNLVINSNSNTLVVIKIVGEKNVVCKKMIAR